MAGKPYLTPLHSVQQPTKDNMIKPKGTPAPKRELRTYTASQPMTLRTLANGTKQIAGYAIVWNSPSVDLGGFVEVCDPAMLDRTRKQNPDILALRDHKQELLLGRTTAGTLQLRTDSKGLAFTISLPATPIGDDTAENVRLGNLSGVSFGFICEKDSWTVDTTGQVTRTLQDVTLLEISPTSFPAYTDTSVSTRSAPVSIRRKLKAEDLDLDDDDSDEDDEDSDDDEERCACPCQECQDGDCAECTEDCDEDENDDCQGCPSLDDTRADKLRIRSLFQSRHKFLSLK